MKKQEVFAKLFICRLLRRTAIPYVFIPWLLSRSVPLSPSEAIKLARKYEAARLGCDSVQQVPKMSRHPTLRWAQRSDKLFITIDLPDAQDVKLKLEPEGTFSFSAISGSEKIPYEVDIDLYDKVDINESKASVGMRNIWYLIEKAEKKWWSRLLKQEGKPPVFVKVDWDKWIDEDEENGNKREIVPLVGNDMDFSDVDFSKLGMGAGEGMDAGAFGEDDEDADDKEGEKIDRAPLAEPVDEPGSSSSKPDAKA